MNRLSPASERLTVMERVILACTGSSAHSRPAARWAAQEASLRGLPLDVVLDPPSDPSDAKVTVRGVPRDPAATGGRPGSGTAMAVAAAGRALVLVPDELASTYRSSGRVLLGVDARGPCDGAIGFAFDSARLRETGLHVVHAWSLPSCAAQWPFGVPEAERATWEDHEVQLLADALRPWRRKYPEVPVLEDVLLLPPAQALLHHCGRAALVVVSRGPGEDCGEIVRSLLQAAACPVAVVGAGG
ncbi:universal stress protein [Streptomyces sp. NPDC002580]|uniref:universal stress protein n=1 Tax=Streptomyces sp. NPDC002580 TaxID=3364653 RepID=UPI003680B5B0